MPQFNAYHNVDAATHQANVTRLSAAGYHMISLCVYGDPAAALYAAVWVEEPASQWVAVHGLDATGYQNWISGTVEAQGFSLRLVSATGPASSPIFAAVAEKSGAAWSARHGMSDADLAGYLDQARKAGMVPVALTAYGDASGRRYAAACQSTRGAIQWTYPGSPLSAADWQNHFNAYARVPSRPGTLAVTADGLYVGVFRNDSLGPEVVRHGMTAADYQAAFNQLTAQGYLPVSVAAGGTGAATRFAAAFAKQTAPIPRSITVTGTAAPTLAGIDGIVERFMTTFGVRAGQVAVLHHGQVVLSRGYTWGEPGYGPTQPTSLMRIASCSKAFTCAAINSLVTAGRLHFGDPVFPLLGITTPHQGAFDPDTITVQNLIDHLGGFNDNGSSGTVYTKNANGTFSQVPSVKDPVFATRDIAQQLGVPGLPGKRDIAAYVHGQPLQFAPGAQVYTKRPDGTFAVSPTGAYSNLGYMLLGLVVEAVSGLPFVDYLRTSVLAPLGLTNLAVSRMSAGPVWPHEVSYDEPNVGPTPFDWASSALTPVVMGGEGLVTELCDSGGGLMTDATTLATFAHTNAAWGVGGRAPGSARSGSEAGCSSLVNSRGNDVDWAYIFNTRWSMDRVAGKDAKGNNQSALDTLGADIGALLDAVAWPSAATAPAPASATAPAPAMA